MKYKLKQIATIVNGSTPSTSNSEYWDGNISWITPKDMSLQMKRYISKGERNITQKGYDSCSTTIVPKNTILLTSRAPIGYISLAQNELCTNQGFKSLVCGNNVLPLFMYYLLSTKVDFLKSISNGATFKELSKQALENIEIDLPNLETQQQIVDTIGSVDDLIEKYEEILEKIDSLLKQKYNVLVSNKELNKVQIKSLPLTITDFVANGSFKNLKDNTEILDAEDYSYFIRNTDLKEGVFNKYVSKETYNFLKKIFIKRT